MLRSTRTIVSLIRSLTFGTAAVVATTAVSSTLLVGCKDESQPEYWVEKLEDQKWRPRAIKRLEQFFEDTITKANKDTNNPEVKALLDKIAEPLTKTYVEHYDTLDTKTRVSLIKLLASFRDKRTEPALKKAFEEFAKKPATKKDEQDIKWAVRAAEDLKLPGLHDPMLQAFLKLQASTPLGSITYKDYLKSMLVNADKSWAGPLKSLLEKEVSQPDRKDLEAQKAFLDQQFWQTTAARLLGEIKDDSAVEPLMKVVMDPVKGFAHTSAILALVKIGKPAMDAALKVLKDEDEKMATYAAERMMKATGSKKPPEDKPHVRIAALVVGTIGRTEAIDPMVKTLEAQEKDVNKAVIARELTKIPASAESKEAFKKAYESIDLDTNIPPGINALQMLSESAGTFFDPTMIEWMLERADKTKGSGESKKGLQATITVEAMKLAKADQLEMVKKAVDDYGTKLEKDMYAQTEKLVKACGDRVACYLDQMEKSENQNKKNQFVGIKAGYMAAALGDEKTAMELAKRLSSFENGAILFVAVKAIDHLLPKGSKEVADQLDDFVTKAEKSADRRKQQMANTVKEVLFRVRARQ